MAHIYLDILNHIHRHEFEDALDKIEELPEDDRHTIHLRNSFDGEMKRVFKKIKDDEEREQRWKDYLNGLDEKQRDLALLNQETRDSLKGRRYGETGGYGHAPRPHHQDLSNQYDWHDHEAELY